MRLRIVSSGSSGNCAVIDGTVVIDVGKTDGVIDSIVAGAVLITHEHSDHIKELPSIQGLPIYAAEDVAERLRQRFPWTPINALRYDTYSTLLYLSSEWLIKPIRLAHDVPCAGFDIIHKGERILFATDFHEIVDTVNLANYDALYLECNNTLDYSDIADVYFTERPPRDEFHRRKSFYNHANADYLTYLIKRDAAHKVPLTLLHKSSYYYGSDLDKIVNLCEIANVQNPYPSN